MLVTYNIIQILALFFFWPALLLVAARKKYRKRIWARCGFGLSKDIPAPKSTTKTLWIHALSVGEVTSAVPLITAIQEIWPQHRIIISTTTTTGQHTAQRLLGDKVTVIVPAPFDFFPVVKHFLQTINPDVYIQIETDFWPNILHLLKTSNIPAILVNGRISERSFVKYKRYRFFFTSMFRNFSELCMQTELDKQRMRQLGIPEKKLHTLGNLKFDTAPPPKNKHHDITNYIPHNTPVLVAGSTHPGEEELILQSIAKLRHRHHTLFSVLVPRDITRAQSLVKMATKFGFTATLRTAQPNPAADLLIVDTIGELVACYRYSSIAFVGGSLVPQGGHNPIEPALFAIPVVFGPYMTSFLEITTALTEHQGAICVRNADELQTTLNQLLTDEATRSLMGKNAHDWIATQRGVISRHLALLENIL